jgi:hypothetical protein
VARGFRHLQDVRAPRPIAHQVEPRAKAHSVVATRALLIRRLLGRRLDEAGVDRSPSRALPALSTVRLVRFPREGQPERRGMTGGCPEARRVLKARTRIDHRPPAPPKGKETVME